MNDTPLFGSYQIKRSNIASGGAGVVHEAISSDGTRVAIKVLNKESIEKKLTEIIKQTKPDLTKNPEEFAKELQRSYERHVSDFKSEYQWLVNLNHPNIAKVHEIGFHEGHFYIAYEYIEGKSLILHMRGWKPVEMVPLFIQVLNGLDYIHRNGIIHLDIKSENILVQMVEGKPVVKIIDFGLAITPKAYSGDFIGTIPTIAPEVALGKKEDVDARADLFSFAAVMYHCITWGVRFPFPRPTSGDIDFLRKYILEREPALEIPAPCHVHRRREGFAAPFLDTIVMRLLAQDPANRFYGNARAVINALSTHLPDAFKDTPDTLGSYLRPELNRYIGRDTEVETVEKNVRMLVDGKQPPYSIFRIVGAKGLGKTHFLNHVRETAERHVEKISVHTISFPATTEALESRIAALTKQLAENTKPLLVLIDNLHDLPIDAGAQSIAQTITGLARLIAEGKRSEVTYSDIEPVMLIFTTGAEDISASPLADFNDVISRIELKPFSVEDIREYLQTTPALKGKDISPERAEALQRSTAGIPLELVDTLQELDSKGLLFDASGEIVLSDMSIDKAGTRAPESTHERLLAQYRALPRPEQEAAEILACWSCRPFLPPLHENEAVENLRSSTAAQVLKVLTQEGIIRHDTANKTYSFADNDYMPELIHEEMDKNTRAATHARIAAFLRDSPSRDAAKSPPKAVSLDYAIGFHLAYGADQQAAIRNCIALSKKMLYNEGKCTIAIELLKRALELTDASTRKLRAYINLLLAEAYHYANRLVETLQTNNDGLNLVIGISRSMEIIFRLREIAYLLNYRDLDKVRPRIDELKTIVSNMNIKRTATYPILLNYDARYYLEASLEYSDRSVELLNKSKEIFEESERFEQTIPSNALQRINNNYLYRVQRLLGDYATSAINAEKRIKQRDLNAIDLAKAYLDLAEIYRLARQYDLALGYAAKALSLANTLTLSFYIYLSHGVLANIYHDKDEFEKSIEACNKRIAAGACLTKGDEYNHLSAHIWTHMGHCYKELKAWDKAIVYFDAAVGSETDAYTKMSAYYGLGVVFYHKGQYEKELEYFTKAEEMLQGMPHNEYVDSYRYRVLMVKAETHIAKKEYQDARKLLLALRQISGENRKMLSECDEMEKRLAAQ